jgi:hypothetical protein
MRKMRIVTVAMIIAMMLVVITGMSWNRTHGSLLLMSSRG